MALTCCLLVTIAEVFAAIQETKTATISKLTPQKLEKTTPCEAFTSTSFTQLFLPEPIGEIVQGQPLPVM